jgi:2-polyprenyl-6-methoxyphenol hydroxylase-like FAD-dependent oxidoreductase
MMPSPSDAVAPVLIVGGGPVGFALALDLAWRGQPSMLVEREPGVATVLLAKATGLHERTMEMCRRWGIVDRVVEVGFPQEFPGDSVYATALNGYFIGRSPIPSSFLRTAPSSTPEKRQRCPQYELDPLLAQVVADRGLTDVRFGMKVEALDPDEDGVTVRMTEVATGRPETVRASYVVGCDGAGSTVRRLIDVPFQGPDLDYSLSAMVRIPSMELPEELSGGERYILLSPEGASSVMTSINGRDIWRLTVVGSQERLNPETFDMHTEVLRALGRDDIPFKIERVAPWRRSQCAAATFRVGRVLLAGDAAHTTSPTGGHGLNTGIGDVSDLGWILPAILQGWGGEDLLAAYTLERRPVAVRNSSASTSNYHAWFDSSECADVLDAGPAGEKARSSIGSRMVMALHSEWNSLGIDLGFRYEGSPIIVPDGTPEPPDDPSDYVQTARPGHRAPHAWLTDGRSTLDLFGHGFVLLRFGHPTDAEDRFEHLAKESGIPLQVIDIRQPEIADLYQRRLILVRPDGFVAWRGDELPADISTLLSTITGRRAESAGTAASPRQEAHSKDLESPLNQ